MSFSLSNIIEQFENEFFQVIIQMLHSIFAGECVRSDIYVVGNLLGYELI